MGTQSKRRTDAEYRAIGKMIEDLYLANNAKPLHLLGYSFLRGLAYGLGIFLAGTIVVALLISILNLFDEAPLIGPLVQNILNSLE